MDEITLKDGRVCFKQAYIEAKTKDLQESGFFSVTEKEVSEQLEKVLQKKPLSIIGYFIEEDICI